MEARNAIADILKQEGVEYLFCFPNSPIIDAAAGAEIRPIVARMERCAVNMADGYTRTLNGRRTGVLTVQAGPGIENAFGGIAQAYADSTPILVLPGQAGTEKLGTPSNFSGMDNYRLITKWAELINSPRRVPEMMRRAFTYLRSGRPSPVLLEVPGDVALAPADNSIQYSPVRPIRSAGDPRDVSDVARALLGAKLPLVYAGQGCLYAEATDELVELAELLHAPVMTTTLGKSSFPENHPLALGAGGNTQTRMVNHFLAKCDLVFGIGTSFQKTLVSAAVPAGKVMIQSTNDAKDINGEYPIDLAIVGDAKLVLRQVIEEVKAQAGANGPSNANGTAAEIKSVKEEWLQQWSERLTSDQVPLNPYRVIWDLLQTVDVGNTIVTHDSGNPRDQMVPFWQTTNPRTYIGWGNSTQLGTGLGLALGAQLAAPDKQCINVMGDTAVGMAGIDFETAVREKIPSITVILNNSAMGGYEKNIPLASERYRTKYTTGDYMSMTQALGSFSQRVERPDEIVPAIRRALASTAAGHPAVLEFITREDPVFSS